MSLILSGTDGLSDVDGSAATPAIRGTDANTGIFFGTDIIGFSEGGVEAARINADSQFVAAAGTAALPVITTTGDTNTGIFFPAADTIAFAEGGAEAMRIDSSGNVGIGTASPAEKLHVAFSTGGLNGIRVQNTNAIGQAAVSYYNDAGTQKADLWWNNNGSTLNLRTLSTDPLIFYTNNSERMRIDSSGNLLVGDTTSNPISSRVNSTAFSLNSTSVNMIARAAAAQIVIGYAGNAGANINFYTDNGSSAVAAGTISSTANTTAYGTGSDYRLKNNVQPMTNALAKIQLLKPCTWIWKEGGHDGEGFIAHELQEIVPSSVFGEKDAVDNDENPKYQQVDTSFLVATLTAAIQEQQALITALTARVTALETP